MDKLRAPAPFIGWRRLWRGRSPSPCLWWPHLTRGRGHAASFVALGSCSRCASCGGQGVSVPWSGFGVCPNRHAHPVLPAGAAVAHVNHLVGHATLLPSAVTMPSARQSRAVLTRSATLMSRASTVPPSVMRGGRVVGLVVTRTGALRRGRRPSRRRSPGSCPWCGRCRTAPRRGV